MIKAASLEVAAGIEAYATEGPRCGGRAKSSPEDFRVEERIHAPGMGKDRVPGYFPLYRVEKRGVTTMRMAEEMSSALRSRVSYGGLKDSRATAVQYITPTSLRASTPGHVSGERFRAELVGWVPKPVTRGSVVGNGFEVVLRDCCEEIGTRVGEAFAAAAAGRVPNYFGLQRFGASERGTHLVGRAMVKRDFQGAVKLIVGETDESENSVRPDWGGRGFGPGQEVERRVMKEVVRSPREWTKALRAVPLRLRRLYVQAYQSYIFNRSLSKAVLAGEDISTYARGDNWAEVAEDGLGTSYPQSAKTVPQVKAAPLMQLPGYAYRDYGSRFDGYVEETLEDEEVSPGEFFIDEMQELSAEGGFRTPHILMKEATWKVEGDMVAMAFTLARGEYATVLLREVMKPEDPRAAGLA